MLWNPITFKKLLHSSRNRGSVLGVAAILKSLNLDQRPVDQDDAFESPTRRVQPFTDLSKIATWFRKTIKDMHWRVGQRGRAGERCEITHSVFCSAELRRNTSNKSKRYQRMGAIQLINSKGDAAGVDIHSAAIFVPNCQFLEA